MKKHPRDMTAIGVRNRLRERGDVIPLKELVKLVHKALESGTVEKIVGRPNHSNETGRHAIAWKWAPRAAPSDTYVIVGAKRVWGRWGGRCSFSIAFSGLAQVDTPDHPRLNEIAEWLWRGDGWEVQQVMGALSNKRRRFVESDYIMAPASVWDKIGKVDALEDIRQMVKGFAKKLAELPKKLEDARAKVDKLMQQQVSLPLEIQKLQKQITVLGRQLEK